MNYFVDFDRNAIRERNEEIGREVRALRLEKRLRKNRGPGSGSRLAGLVSRSTLPLLRRAGIAG